MDLSVVIPTHNHCEFLRETLDRLRRQAVPSDLSWEVIIVNNNCTDATQEVIQTAVAQFPVPLKMVKEARLGVSSARNRGIEKAIGRVLAFLDDDTFPEHHWIQTVWDSFETYSCDCVIGRIELHWRAKRPLWVTAEVLGFLGRLDYGTTPHRVDTLEETPNGGNMAFKRTAIDEVGGFDVTLGRVGRALFGGEEPEIFKRFLQKGFRAIYQPNAVVYHVIDSWRLQKSYFRRVHFNEGKVRGRLLERTNAKTIAGVPLYVLPQFVRSISEFGLTIRHEGLQNSLRKEMNIWYFLGLILGCVQGRQIRRDVFS